MSRYIFIVVIMILGNVCYFIGRSHAKAEIRTEYPELINFRPVEDRMNPNPGDLWITNGGADGAHVHYYLPGEGWVQFKK